jgi:hypothetical protein
MNFANIQQISEQFDTMIPAIAVDFEKWVTKNLENIINKYSRAEISKLGNSFSNDGEIWRQLRTFTIMVDETGEKTTRFTSLYKVDYNRIKAESIRYAQSQVDAFKYKLQQKLFDLTDISDLKIFGLEFTFYAKLAEHKIRIEQTTVLKCSCKGKIFNQWPCRIYVDGKMMPETKFKKLQEEVKLWKATNF